MAVFYPISCFIRDCAERRGWVDFTVAEDRQHLLGCEKMGLAFNGVDGYTAEDYDPFVALMNYLDDLKSYDREDAVRRLMEAIPVDELIAFDLSIERIFRESMSGIAGECLEELLEDSYDYYNVWIDGDRLDKLASVETEAEAIAMLFHFIEEDEAE